jgi:hypothetical protein
MKNLKKRFALLAVLGTIVCSTLMVGCGGGGDDEATTTNTTTTKTTKEKDAGGDE